jgi:cytochrome bd ubiquinol oxidase subunit I
VAGWYVTEIGRQPYIVFGLLKTSEVASNVPAPTIALSLALYLTVYLALIVSYIGVVKYMAEKHVDAIEAEPRAVVTPITVVSEGGVS